MIYSVGVDSADVQLSSTFPLESSNRVTTSQQIKLLLSSYEWWENDPSRAGCRGDGVTERV